MDATKVIIENWPKTNYLLVYIPLFIALSALVVSWYSAYLTRKSFIMSHRPYVWGSSYAVIDSDNKTIIPVPHKVGYRVRNSPARIIRSEVKISLNKEMLLVNTVEDLVRFPDEKSEWSFGVGEKNFKEIMDRSDEEKSKLVRLISLYYSSFCDTKIYHYELTQSFEPSENQWKDTNEKSD